MEEANASTKLVAACDAAHQVIYVTRIREPNFSYRLLRVIYPFFRVVFPNQVIRADDLARAMIECRLQRKRERRSLVLENRDIRAWSSRIMSLRVSACIRLKTGAPMPGSRSFCPDDVRTGINRPWTKEPRLPA